MKIVVLAGGLSDERNVSLSSGCKVCAALRERGHQAALVDMYLGAEGDPGALFSAPIPAELTKIGRQAPDLAAVKAARPGGGESQFGPGVLEACRLADVVFLGLHGACGEDGRVQAAFDLMGIPYTGAGHLGSAIAMDKDLTKRMVAPLGVATPKWELVKYTAEDIPALSARLDVPCARAGDSASRNGKATKPRCPLCPRGRFTSSSPSCSISWMPLCQHGRFRQRRSPGSACSTPAPARAILPGLSGRRRPSASATRRISIIFLWILS